MDLRIAIAYALTAQVSVAATTVAARLPGPAGGDRLVTTAGPAYSGSPTPAPVPVPSATRPPPLPPVTPPPLPPVTVPPLPPVSLPSVSLPPLAPPLLCPEDLGTTDLPAYVQSVDISHEDGAPAGPISADGRIWYSVLNGGSHFTGVDPATGSRVVVPAGTDAQLLGVAGSFAWTAEERSVVVYDVRSRAEVRRWDRDNVKHGGVPLDVVAARGDAGGGGWLLGAAIEGEARVVVRVRADGSVAWSTALPGPFPAGWSVREGDTLAVRDGQLYVGMSAIQGRRTAVWRVTADGTVAARRDLPYPSRMATLPMAAGPHGIYAAVYRDADLDVTVVRLDPADLRVLASAAAFDTFDLFAGGGAVYTAGEVCSFNLSRYDPVTLRRTGFWRTDRPKEGVQGTVHDGAVWMLYAPEAVPVALHRYELP